jgi:hypothetical protein
MPEPKLLLLDEPSAGLAPVIVQRVFELVTPPRAVSPCDRRVQVLRVVVSLPAQGGEHPLDRHCCPAPRERDDPRSYLGV